MIKLYTMEQSLVTYISFFVSKPIVARQTCYIQRWCRFPCCQNKKKSFYFRTSKFTNFTNPLELKQVKYIQRSKWMIPQVSL